MITLLPFNPGARCPKCDHDKVTTSYEPPVAVRLSRRRPAGECLRRTCCQCKYEWYEQPLDGPDALVVGDDHHLWTRCDLRLPEEVETVELDYGVREAGEPYTERRSERILLLVAPGGERLTLDGWLCLGGAVPWFREAVDDSLLDLTGMVAWWRPHPPLPADYDEVAEALGLTAGAASGGCEGQEES